MKDPCIKWGIWIFLLFLCSLSSGCKTPSASNNNSTYYTYDAKYGGYPSGRIEKQGDTYYIYDSKYGGYPIERIEKKGNSFYLYNSKYGGYPVGRVKKR